MSYKDYLNKRITDLEQTISKTSEEKEKIQLELNKLKLAEFEEDMATESNQQLLKG
jgi:cell division protein FtsL